MDHCPCGSGKLYKECCGKFHRGEAFASTPQELMRSRYSAFTKGDTDYLIKTMKGAPLESFDAETREEWARSVKWLGLTIVKAPIAEKDIGWVEFIARYEEAGKKCQIHELSEFHRIEGKWYYVNGKHFTN